MGRSASAGPAVPPPSRRRGRAPPPALPPSRLPSFPRSLPPPPARARAEPEPQPERGQRGAGGGKAAASGGPPPPLGPGPAHPPGRDRAQARTRRPARGRGGGPSQGADWPAGVRGEPTKSTRPPETRPREAQTEPRPRAWGPRGKLTTEAVSSRTQRQGGEAGAIPAGADQRARSEAGRSRGAPPCAGCCSRSGPDGAGRCAGAARPPRAAGARARARARAGAAAGAAAVEPRGGPRGARAGGSRHSSPSWGRPLPRLLRCDGSVGPALQLQLGRLQLLLRHVRLPLLLPRRAAAPGPEPLLQLRHAGLGADWPAARARPRRRRSPGPGPRTQPHGRLRGVRRRRAAGASGHRGASGPGEGAQPARAARRDQVSARGPGPGPGIPSQPPGRPACRVGSPSRAFFLPDPWNLRSSQQPPPPGFVSPLLSLQVCFSPIPPSRRETADTAPSPPNLPAGAGC